MSRVALPGPTDYVWLAHTYQLPVVFHEPTHDRADREYTDGRGNVGPMAGWAWTACGLLLYAPQWDEKAGRFYLGYHYGTDAPLRLLNPAATRPCRRCYHVAS